MDRLLGAAVRPGARGKGPAWLPSGAAARGLAAHILALLGSGRFYFCWCWSCGVRALDVRGGRSALRGSGGCRVCARLLLAPLRRAPASACLGAAGRPQRRLRPLTDCSNRQVSGQEVWHDARRRRGGGGSGRPARGDRARDGGGGQARLPSGPPAQEAVPGPARGRGAVHQGLRALAPAPVAGALRAPAGPRRRALRRRLLQLCGRTGLRPPARRREPVPQGLRRAGHPAPAGVLESDCEAAAHSRLPGLRQVQALCGRLVHVTAVRATTRPLSMARLPVPM
mmetsp:Transcript_102704/g.306793  ORF Transcript_102704/g.306793 Transcript_102704/m.306793 type:complete len:283 (+) Transcript_102704:207-1055(+)